MRAPLIALAVVTLSLVTAQANPIVIRADRVVDGRGHALQNATVIVDGARIRSVGNAANTPVTYDLKGMTLIPGLIDVHSHLTWYFNREGRYHTGRGDNDTPVQ